MKIFAQKSTCRRQCTSLGFTLTEMLVASTIFLVIIVAAMISVQLYGLRVYNLATAKVKVITGGRETLNDIRDRIRSCQSVNVGFYTNNGFIGITNANQIGNALQIVATTNAPLASALVFYQDPANTNISLASNGVVISVEANYVTNHNCFQAEDYQGNILTNYGSVQDNPVIAVTLQFSQLAFPAGYGGGGAANAYDYYRLHTRIAMRVKN